MRPNIFRSFFFLCLLLFSPNVFAAATAVVTVYFQPIFTERGNLERICGFSVSFGPKYLDRLSLILLTIANKGETNNSEYV